MSDIRRKCGMELATASCCIERVARTIRACAPNNDISHLWDMSSILNQMSEQMLPGINEWGPVPNHLPDKEGKQ